MTILVTGGAGYIGSHTVRTLRASGQDVVVLDSLEFGDEHAVIDAPLVIGRIQDADLVTSTCREHGVTQIVHFAAYKSVGESMESPSKYWRNNVPGTVELIETKGLHAVSLRYFSAAGASFGGRIGEDWTYSINLIPLAMKAVLLGDRKLQVFGDDYDTPDGSCIRDYIHVDDLADAHVKALDYLARGGETVEINVGTGVGSSVLEVIKATEQASGQPVPYEIVGRRAGDPVATFADPTFAEATLGWRAQYGLDEIVRTAYAWHASQV